MQCCKCLWSETEIGCYYKKGNIIGKSCRVCMVLSNPIIDYDKNKLLQKQRRLPCMLLRHDGKEWFSKVERKNPKVVIVLITKDK